MVADVSLFLGFFISPSYEQLLQSVAPEKRGLFIGKEQRYLQEVEFEGRRYLGKFAGCLNEVSQLNLLEQNVLSILTKMIPDYPYHQEPLLLFVVPTVS